MSLKFDQIYQNVITWWAIIYKDGQIYMFVIGLFWVFCAFFYFGFLFINGLSTQNSNP
jgi:hypothetical protein